MIHSPLEAVQVWLLVDQDVPVVLVFGFAQLDGTQVLVELGADGAGFLAELVALACLGVVDALDGADDGGGTASASLLAFSQFFDGDGTTLDLDAHILGQLHQALVGDAGQDGGRLRGDVDTVLDGEEVGGAGFVDIFLFLGVQVELAGVLAAVASLGVGPERSGVVATDLVDTGSEGSRTVILAGDDVGVGLEAALEVGSHGGYEDEEEVLVGGFHAHGDAGADEQRTQVEAGAGAVGRDEALVHLDDELAHFDEALGGQFGHHNAAAGALQASGVLVGTEQADLAVLATVGFQTLEGLLTVVKARSGHMDVDAFLGGDFNLAPFAVAIPAAYVIIRFQVTKRKVLPIYIHNY